MDRNDILVRDCNCGTSPTLVEVYSQANELIGLQCSKCGVVFGKGRLKKCKTCDSRNGRWHLVDCPVCVAKRQGKRPVKICPSEPTCNLCKSRERKCLSCDATFTATGWEHRKETCSPKCQRKLRKKRLEESKDLVTSEASS